MTDKFKYALENLNEIVRRVEKLKSTLITKDHDRLNDIIFTVDFFKSSVYTEYENMMRNAMEAASDIKIKSEKLETIQQGNQSSNVIQPKVESREQQYYNDVLSTNRDCFDSITLDSSSSVNKNVDCRDHIAKEYEIEKNYVYSTRLSKLVENGIVISTQANRKKKKSCKSFVCKCCNIIFSSKYDLTSHISISHEGKNRKSYYCEDCNRNFVNKSHYDYHNKRHANELFDKSLKGQTEPKLYPCIICGLEFNKKSYLTGHMRDVHAGEIKEPYNCVFCYRKFVNKSHLDYHIETHKREKPFSCVYCKKQFIHMINLDKHLKVHNENSNFNTNDI